MRFLFQTHLQVYWIWYDNIDDLIDNALDSRPCGPTYRALGRALMLCYRARHFDYVSRRVLLL